jgi:hypothetical protein
VLDLVAVEPPRDAALAQHRRTVREAGELLEAMGHVEDRLPGRRVAAQRLVQHAHLGPRQRRGRLVEHEDPVLPVVLALQQPRDRDHLLRDGPQALEPVVRVGVDAEALERARGLGAQPPPVDAAGRPPRVARPRGEVLGDAQRAERRVLLVQEAQVVLVGDARRQLVGPQGPRAEGDAAGVRLLDAGQHLDQGRLPRPVGAEEGMDLPGAQVQADAVEGDRRAEAPAEALDDQARRLRLTH